MSLCSHTKAPPTQTDVLTGVGLTGVCVPIDSLTTLPPRPSWSSATSVFCLICCNDKTQSRLQSSRHSSTSLHPPQVLYSQVQKFANNLTESTAVKHCRWFGSCSNSSMTTLISHTHFSCHSTSGALASCPTKQQSGIL